MESFFAPLLEKAFDRAPALEANAAIARTREALGETVRSFEAVVAPDAGAEWLGTKLVPRMVYHLESLGVRPPLFGGIFVSMFVGDQLFFLYMRDVMEFACARLDLTAEQLYARWGTGEARHAIDLASGTPDEPAKPGPLLVLPPGKAE